MNSVKELRKKRLGKKCLERTVGNFTIGVKNLNKGFFLFASGVERRLQTLRPSGFKVKSCKGLNIQQVGSRLTKVDVRVMNKGSRS